MSSAGQAVGGVVGAVAGFFIGGPSGALYGAQIGMMAGGLIDPPKGPNITGPRLDDLKVQTSTYGAPIPRLYGTIATAGNIFWLENNALKEVAKKKKSGGKGGPSTTTTTFSYYATFALGLCDCSGGSPIAGVRRIWCGANLIYDAGSSDIGSILASNEAASLFTLHDGSLTQLPDDRMQATIGVSNTPAYRGLAYIVFNDFPLEKHSNSLMAAQFKVEIITSSSSNGVILGYKNLSGDPRIYQSTSLYIDDSAVLYVFRCNAASIYSPTLCQRSLFLVSENRELLLENLTTYPTGGVLHVTGWSDSEEYVSKISGGAFSVFNGLGVSIFSAQTNITSIDANSCRYHKRGINRYLVTRPTSTSGIITDISNSQQNDIFITETSDFDGAIHDIFIGKSFNYAVTTYPKVVCYDKDWIKLWDRDLSSYSITISNNFGSVGGVIRELKDQTIILRNGSKFFIIDELNVLLLVNYSAALDINFGNLGGDHLIYPLWITYNSTLNKVTVLNLDAKTIDGTHVTLQEIVNTELINSNLIDLSDVDSSALIQEVRGYRVSTVSAIRGAIDPLQSAWPFDVIQSGYNIVFKPRGGISVATIPASDLAARGSSDSSGVSITNVREMDSVLPRRVVANYLDVTREYDTGTQSDERLNTDSVNIRTVEIAIVMNSTEALGLVQTLLYLYWLERYDISFSLPSTYNHLEPGDPITINADEATYSLRLTNVTYTQDGRIECAAKYNASAIYIHAASADEGQSNGQMLTLAGGTAIELLDIPLLLDSLDTPGFPVAMTGYLPGWPGGELFRSDDAGQTWIDLQGFTTPGAVIGTASNVLSAPESTAMIDKASTLTVNLIRGELSSVTELAMLNGANYFAYGAHGRWEIIAAQNCVIQVSGAYILTDLLRGQQGTEWACGLHAVGDKVVEIDASVLSFVSANLNSIGMMKTYRGVTIGKTIDSASDVNFTYSGTNLECLSPVYINGNRNASNDWSLTWIRRTRVGGALRDYVDASLGEASEAYEVEIYSSNTYATLKRTISGLTSASAAYTSAQQITDFGSNQSTLYVKIYQLSANVGRGYPLITSITR